MPPLTTTTRVPNRSERAPQANDPTPMARKLRSAAVEIPVRVQPIDSDIGWRKTPSEVTEPCPMQLMTIPTPTITQP